MIKQAEILLNFLKSYLIHHFEIWRQLALKIQSRFFLNKFCFDNRTKAMIDGSLLYFGFLFFVFDLIFEVLSLKCFEKVLVKGLLASCSPA